MAKPFYDIYGFYYKPFWQQAWFWQYVAIGIILFLLLAVYVESKLKNSN